MKKLLTVLTAMVLLSGFGHASAANSLKVGVVDLPQIMQKSPQVQSINQKLQTQFGPQQQKIMGLQNQMRSEASQLAPTATAKLSDADKKKVQDKLAADQKQLQQMVEQFQTSVTTAQNKAMQDFMTQINTTVKNIAQKQQLDLVLLKPAVIFAENTIDITNDVMSQLPK